LRIKRATGNGVADIGNNVIVAQRGSVGIAEARFGFGFHKLDKPRRTYGAVRVQSDAEGITVARGVFNAAPFRGIKSYPKGQ